MDWCESKQVAFGSMLGGIENFKIKDLANLTYEAMSKKRNEQPSPDII